jgi:hypothetical protein
MNELPSSSRLAKEIRNDPLSSEEHLLLTIVDILTTVAYQTSISAAGAAGDEYRRIMKDAPKPIERPTIYYEEPEVEELEFTSISDLQSVGFLKINQN